MNPARHPWIRIFALAYAKNIERKVSIDELEGQRWNFKLTAAISGILAAYMQ